MRDRFAAPPDQVLPDPLCPCCIQDLQVMLTTPLAECSACWPLLFRSVISDQCAASGTRGSYAPKSDMHVSADDRQAPLRECLQAVTSPCPQLQGDLPVLYSFCSSTVHVDYRDVEQSVSASSQQTCAPCEWAFALFIADHTCRWDPSSSHHRADASGIFR